MVVTNLWFSMEVPIIFENFETLKKIKVGIELNSNFDKWHLIS